MPLKHKLNYSESTAPEKDCWETPAVAYEAIRWWIEDFTLWESAYGTGRSTDNLSKLGYCVTSTNSGVEADFFKTQPSSYGRHYEDVIQVTNPPYSRKYEWIQRSYELGYPFALLMPADTFASSKGMRPFAQYGVTIIVPEHRIAFVHPETHQPAANANISTAWFLWHGGNDCLKERLATRMDGEIEKIGYVTLPRVRDGRKLRQLTDEEYFEYATANQPKTPNWF